MFEEPVLQKTPEQIQAEFENAKIKAFTAYANETVRMIEERIRGGFNMAWNDPEFCAKSFFKALGSQGAKSFSDSYKVQLLLKELNPDFQMISAPMPYTIDSQTGIVTITEVATPESENP